MAKKLSSELLIIFENNIKNFARVDSNERKKQLYKIIRHLYTIGWNYDEVINYFNSKKLFNSEAEKITKFVFTQDIKYNPFGFWYTFQYEIPLLILSFAIQKIKSTTLSEAGIIFSLYLLNKENSNRYSRSKLENAIAQHKNERIIEELTNISKKKNIILIDRPSILRLFSDINKETLQKSLKKINEALNVNLNVYFESYSDSDIKSRAWITGYRKVLKAFNLYYKENRLLVKEYISSIEDITKGGINIVDIDSHILKNDKYRYKAEYEKELNKYKAKSDEVHSYYENCLNKKQNISLKKLFNRYESIFSHDKYTFLNQLPINSNRALRIYKKRKNYFIACQSAFINYALILSSLYGDKSLAKTYINNEDLIDKLPFDKIPDEKSVAIIKAVAGYRIKFIKSQIGNHIHPMDSPLNIKVNRHFNQINEVTDVIDRMSNNGITINYEKLKEIYKDVTKRIKSKENELPTTSEENEISDFSKLKFKDDEDLVTELDNMSQKKLKLLKKRLRQYMSSAKSLRKTGRLYGHFRSHGAKTHRITCSRINLQGIPKSISMSIFKASPGYKLLSADVAGQDIVVTANLARKIANTPSMYEGLEGNIVTDALESIQGNIDDTIRKLSRKTFNPIDEITSEVLKDYTIKYPDTDFMIYDPVRKFIKQIVYAKFYGGGKKSVLEEEIIKVLNGINLSITSLIPIIEIPDLVKLLTKANDKGALSDYLNLKIEIDQLYKKHLEGSEEGKLFLSNFNKGIDYIGKLVYLYKTSEDVIRTILPGTMEIFPVMEEYLKQSNLNLIFPSALGWQTVIDPLKDYEYKDDITKSKAYVIQSTGAELIRQWLLELSKSDLYRTHQFKILLAIHDQIVLEVLNDKVDIVKGLLSTTLSNAADNIGLDGKTFHLPDIKELGL